MTPNPANDRQMTLAPMEKTSTTSAGGPAGRLIVEYGDYECPYSRQAYHAIEQVEQHSTGTSGSRSAISH